jgi:hypothetical protein
LRGAELTCSGMNEKKDWKDQLLRSGVPLEYAAARILAAEQFAVRHDYAYGRKDDDLLKEFTVDIQATGYAPFNNPNRITAFLEILVECKYRTPATTWLFFPDANIPDFFPGSQNHTFSVLDNFSSVRLRPDALNTLADSMPFCSLGLEINSGSKEAHTAELRRAVNQIRYATPHWVRDAIEFYSFGHIDDVKPIIFTKIILTTADIRVSKEKTSIENIKSSTVLDDISSRCDALILYSDYGFDFTQHWKSDFANFDVGEFLKDKTVQEVTDLWRDYRSKKYKYAQLPQEVIEEMVAATRYKITPFSTEYIICHFSSFRSLIKNIKKAVNKSVKRGIKLHNERSKRK